MSPRVRNFFLTSTALFAFAPAPGMAGPDGPVVVGGTASVTGAGTGTVNVTQGSDRAIINWNTFNIGKGETTTFSQPSSSSIILNRVTGGQGPSDINGTLNANGNVFLINRDGVFFGPGASINTAGFLATTSNIRNSDFMAGRLNFNRPGRPDASIVNMGNITATQGGFAALVAPGVRNSGTITATLGTVSLASGNMFTLDMYGDKLIQLGVNDKIAAQVKDVATGQPLTSLVTNEGKIKANGGRIELTAAAARTIVDSVINNKGVLEANSIGHHNGMIVLGAATGGTKGAGAPTQTVKVSGKISVAGKKAGTTGGTVVVTGENIEVAGAHINASGKAGGGKVMIGGDWGGGNPTSGLVQNQSAKLEGYAIPTATTLSVDAATRINASATASGNGGKVVLWSDTMTTFAGLIEARGGAQGGNGGFVETSSHGQLNFLGTVDTLAPAGTAGTLLLDPADYYIVATLGSSPAGASEITSTQVQNLLATQNVVIATNNQSNPSGQNGDIFVNSAVNWAFTSTSGSLTLAAYRDININANISTTYNTAVLRADSTGTGIGTVNFAPSTSVTAYSGASIFYNPTSYTSPTNYSANQPYGNAYMLVNNASDLGKVGTNLGGNYALGKDISATTGPGGTFTGIFTGNGGLGTNYTITGLTGPLFDTIDTGAAVRDLNLANVTITGVFAGPTTVFGTLANYNFGFVTNVTASGTIDASIIDNATAGGLVGYNAPGASISGSSANVAVAIGTGDAAGPFSFTRSAHGGGLVGLNYGSISNSSASGAVSGSYNTLLGGLVGTNGDINNPGGPISGSFATGAVTISSPSTLGYAGIAGGLVGDNWGAITSSYATGNVAINGKINIANAGGLVGQLRASPSPFHGSITNSYASGAVSLNITSGTSGSAAGGLVGTTDSATTITNAYALGNVSATTSVGGYQLTLGGLVGGNSAAVTSAYSTGAVSASGGLPTVGGFFGANGVAASNAYWDTVSSGTATGVGSGSTTGVSGLTASQHYQQSAYTGFNFSIDWFMVNGQTRPFLRTEYSQTITNSHQLQLISMNLAANYTLANNISLSSDLTNPSGMWNPATGFAPIGSIGSPFTGSLNGQGHTIDHLSITAASGPAGLFSSIGSSGSVSNLNLTSAIIVAGGNGMSIGALVGQNNGTISNVTVTGTVTGLTHTGIGAGGLAGTNSGTISQSSTTAAATVGNGSTSAGGFNYAGGLVGFNTGTISQSSAIGGVVGGTNSFVGGLAGQNSNLITASFATGAVAGADSAGGLVGFNASGAVITGSHANGFVVLNSGGTWAGGLVGQNVGTVTQSYYDSLGVATITGSGTASQSAILGGLVAQNQGTVTNSHANATIIGNFVTAGGLVGYNFGSILGTGAGFNATANIAVGGDQSVAGGLVGHSAPGSSIANANASGLVGAPGTANTALGGLVGFNEGSVDHSSANVAVAGGLGSLGGLVGQNSGAITFATAMGNVSGAGSSTSGVALLGGLVGNNQSGGTIGNSNASGNLTGGTFSQVGGLVGFNQGAITTAYATGNVVLLVGTSSGGGLVGINAPGATITDAQAFGTVTANAALFIGQTNSHDVGGLVGINNGTVKSSTQPGAAAACSAGASFSCASGAVSTGSYGTAGGLVGINTGATMSAFATGAVTRSDQTIEDTRSLGGLVGTNLGTVVNSHATGDVAVVGPGGFQIRMGGLVGDNSGAITNSFATGNMSAPLGSAWVGGLVGNNAPCGACGGSDNSASIANSHATGNVTVGAISQAGGLVGFNRGSIADSYATGNVTVGSGNGGMLGGLVGYNVGDGGTSGTITNSYATGNVSGGAFTYLGGLVGLNVGDGGTSGAISGSHASGNVTGGSNESIAGGFFGANVFGAISNSYATGAVSVGNGSTAGGFAGLNLGTITVAASSGAVSGGDNSFVGGFVGVNFAVVDPGINFTTGSITKSLTTSPATGGANSYVAGFAAINVGSLDQTFAAGLVTGGAGSTTGGLVASNTFSYTLPAAIAFLDPPGTATNSYWDRQTTGQTASAGGSAFDTAQLTSGTPLPPGFDPAAWGGTAGNYPFLLGLGLGGGTPGSAVLAALTTGQPTTTTPTQPTTTTTTTPPAQTTTTSSSPITTTTSTNPIFTTTTTTVTATLPDTQVTPSALLTVQQLTQEQSVNPTTFGEVVNTQALAQLQQQQQTQPQGQPQPGATPLSGFGAPPIKLNVGEGRYFYLPPVGETRIVQNEAVLQLPCDVSQTALAAATRQVRMTVLSSQCLGSTNLAVYRVQIGSGQTLETTLRGLAAHRIIVAAQANYVFRTTQDPAAAGNGPAREGDPEQYVVDKLSLTEVHRLVKGNNVSIAVIDSEIDGTHPDLAGAIGMRYDATNTVEKPQPHGTGMAGAIGSHGKLIGIAPGAKLTAIRAFLSKGGSAESTTYNILKGLDFAVANSVRIVNMSFAGPQDPSFERNINEASKKGLILIAAAGNAGPKSPPLYPAANPNVIAVTAVDMDNKVFSGANRGKHIAIASPGVDVLVPAPEGTYQLTTGTSVATAHVSGVVALLLERNPRLTAAEVRRILIQSAKKLGPANDYGAGLIDPVKALELAAPKSAALPAPTIAASLANAH